MFKFLKRLFVPTRLDAFILAIVIHWLVAIVIVTAATAFAHRIVSYEASAIFYAAGASWLAIAATIGWKSNSNRRTLLLLVSSIASLGFVVGWFYLNAADLFTQLQSSTQQQNHQGLHNTSQFIYESCWTLGYCIVASFAVWIVNWIARCSIHWTNNPFVRLGTKFKNNRTSVLLVIAGLLFFIAMVSRLPASLFRIFDGFGGAMVACPVIIGTVSYWAVFLFWFPRSMVLDGKPVQKFASLAVVLLLFGLIVANAILNNDADFLSNWPPWIVGGVIFVLSVIGVGGEESRNRSVSDQPTVEETSVARFIFRPTFFSLVPVLLLSAAIATPWYLDLSFFAMPHQGKSFADQYELAVESARLSRQSGGAIKLYFQDQVMTCKVQFDSNSSPQLLDNIQKPLAFNCIELSGMESGYDLSGLRGSQAAFALTNCEVSHSQLDQIIGSAAWLQISGSFSVVDDGTLVNPGTLNSIVFRDTNPGAVAAFFDAVPCEKQIAQLFLYTPVGNEDWPAVEEVAQSGYAFVYGGWTGDFVMPETHRSLKKVQFFDLSNINHKVKIDKELFLNTDIKFLNSMLTDSANESWKLLMLRGRGEFEMHVDSIASSEKTFAERAKELGMAYLLGKGHSVDSLYFPWGEAKSVPLPELRVLSYDPSWVCPESLRFQMAPVNLGHLKVLANLEELYFPPMLVPESIAFLADLKSLKHLQMLSVIRTVTGSVGFDTCQSLESITFFGTPDNQSYLEVAKLKNLKRLVIVNSDEDELLTPEYRDKLAEKLPGVEVEILEPTETESLVPKPFREYRDRVRKELRADTTWLDEILKKPEK